MRIAFVVPLLAPYAISRFAELGRNKDVDLHVIVEKDTFEERKGWKYQEIEGVHTYLLDGKTHGYSVEHKESGYSINNAYLYSKGLKKLVRKIDPDFCIVCNSTQILELFGFRKYKLGVVVEDTLRAEQGRKKLNRMVKRALLKTADFYLPFSEDAVCFLRSNGINSNFYRSSWSIGSGFFRNVKSDIIALKNKYSINEEKQIYTIVSALIPRKGIIQFINAWNCMSDRFKTNKELHILGSGPLEKEIKELIEKYELCNCIKLEGNRPYLEVAEFLECTDVFVLPTLEDLCSLAVFEAVAFGLPIMTTIYNGARDLVVEGVNGYVFDPEQNDSIVEALNKIDNSDLQTMSKESLEIAKKYTDENVMKELYSTLQGIMKK